MNVTQESSASDPQRGETKIRLTLDGASLDAVQGDSIAAAMVAAGEHRFRDCKSGRPRGLFCGMGVCGECQLLVDGKSRRACLTKAADGQVIRRLPPKRELSVNTQRAEVADWREEDVDILVVGAGPAGLSAALVAAKHGLNVLVLDERSQAGGQYFKQPAKDYGLHADQLDAQFREGAQLIDAAIAAGARYQPGATAWGGFNESKLAVTVVDGDGEETRLIKARRFILASGAYERPVPVPGWTLPGVMTTGAAQTLLRAYRKVPGRRVLVAGNGPLNFQVARELKRAGSEVCAIVEAAASPARSPWQFLRMALADPTLTFDGLRQVGGLRRSGVPLHFGYALIRLDGSEHVESATIGRIGSDGRLIEGTELEIAVDAVCMNYGFLPQADLARSLGCRFTFDPLTAAWTARRDADGRTSVEHVFLVGDACGLGGARVAMAEGEIAGHAAVRDCNGSSADNSPPPQTLQKLKRSRRFQTALWTMFRSPLLTTQLATPDTLVCRCENVTRSELEQAISANCHSLAAVKKQTRAGMGRCQGRYCALTSAALAVELGFEQAVAESFFAPRPPIKPLTAGSIAGAAGDPPVPVELSTDDRYANIS